MILAAGLGTMVAAGIAAPLATLARAADRLADEDPAVPTSPLARHGPAEVVRLAGAFSDMRDRLAARTAERDRDAAELQQAYRELLATQAELASANAELASANTELEERAATDTLTGLASRDRSHDVLEKFMGLAERQQVPLVLAFLDLDHFKIVNDQYGHLVGDQVLREFGVLLRSSFRGADVVARWGGEEFVIGMFGTTRQDAVKRLEVVLARLRAMDFTAPDGTTFHVTCSAGIAQYPTDAADVTALHRLADQALYQAKAAGRDRVVASS
jgi:diguanylate cyclase (GGDEF)-like protein